MSWFGAKRERSLSSDRGDLGGQNDAGAYERRRASRLVMTALERAKAEFLTCVEALADQFGSLRLRPPQKTHRQQPSCCQPLTNTPSPIKTVAPLSVRKSPSWTSSDPKPTP